MAPAVARSGSTSLGQACAHCTLGIIFVGSWISEIGQHAVAHVSGDKAIVSADRLGGALLVYTQDLTEVLRVETRRERGRVHDIAEHHRDLPSLGGRHYLVRSRMQR